jgi:uncharacterized protein
VTQHTNKAEQDRQFHFRYHLSFETMTKGKNWNNIFALWHSAANGGHIRAMFIFELALESIKRTDETKNI